MKISDEWDPPQMFFDMSFPELQGTTWPRKRKKKTRSSPIFRLPSTDSDSDSDMEASVLSPKEMIERGKTKQLAEIQEKIAGYLKEEGAVKEPVGDLNKWIVKRLSSDNYEAHVCRTSWTSSLSLPKVLGITNSYEFVEVIVGGENGDELTRVVVDMDFRSQFELAIPTPEFKSLTDSLPTTFVGTEDVLSDIISFMCAAGKVSLKEKGIRVPPWRKERYMQAKWFENCRRLAI